LILSLFSAILYLVMTPAESEQFVHEILYHNREAQSSYSLPVRLQILRIQLFKYIFAVEVLLTVFFGLRLINRFNEKVLTYYSNVQDKELRSIRILLLFLVVTSFISLVSDLIGKDFFSDHPYLLAIPSITHSLALFGISYAGYRQLFSIRELTQEMNAGNDNDNVISIGEEEGQNGSEFDQLDRKLEQLMQEEKIYLNPELRLNDLAALLGTNRTYASQLIHNRRNLNFCDYVNDYRIQHAKKLLSETADEPLPIEEVALRSGFASNSTFYRVFTDKVGISPSCYRKLNGR
jgi:AraC-like DNA-binding protein